MRPITFAIFCALAGLQLVVPRRWRLVPFIVAACFVPMEEQRIIIFGLDFTVLRLLVLVGILQLMGDSTRKRIELNYFDKALLAFCFVSATVYFLQWMTISALIFKCGVLFDILGMYWIFRYHITSWDDIYGVAYAMGLCAVFLIPFTIFEMVTGRTPFFFLGDVGVVVNEAREGMIRCQGSHANPIFLGLYWAVSSCSFMCYMVLGKKRYLFGLALVSAGLAVVASASSTPVIVLFLAIVGMATFHWRYYVGLAWKVLFMMAIALHIVMNGPVTRLIDRLTVVKGSVAAQRSALIEAAVAHFPEWVFLGTRRTDHWGYALTDVTNQFVFEAVQGGLISLILFLVLIYLAFRTISRTMRVTKSKEYHWVLWFIYIMLLAHCASFIGVSYFNQIEVLWYLALAFVGFCAGQLECGERVIQRHHISTDSITVCTT